MKLKYIKRPLTDNLNEVNEPAASETSIQKKSRELKEVISKDIYDFSTEKYIGKYTPLNASTMKLHLTGNKRNVELNNHTTNVIGSLVLNEDSTEFSNDQLKTIGDVFAKQLMVVENSSEKELEAGFDKLVKNYVNYLKDNGSNNIFLSYLTDRINLPNTDIYAVRGGGWSFNLEIVAGPREKEIVSNGQSIGNYTDCSHIFFYGVNGINGECNNIPPAKIFLPAQAYLQHTIYFKFNITAKSSIDDIVIELRKMLDRKLEVLQALPKAPDIITELTKNFGNTFKLENVLAARTVIKVDELENNKPPETNTGYKFTDKQILDFLNWLEENFKTELAADNIEEIVRKIRNVEYKTPINIVNMDLINYYYIFKQALDINILASVCKNPSILGSKHLGMSDDRGCSSLEDPIPLTLNNQIDNILYSYQSTNPVHVKLMEGVKEIPSGCFNVNGNGSLNIYLPNSLTDIKPNAFVANMINVEQYLNIYFHSKGDGTGFTVPADETDFYKKVLRTY